MRFLIAFLCASIACASVALAQAVTAAAGSELESKFELGSAEARSYLSAHAQMLLEPEQRLANGVAWRLQTDAVTRMKEPRITWMPDRNRMATANMLFEVIQGNDLFRARQMRKEWDDWFAERAQKRLPVEDLDAEQLGDVQGEVRLTYASANLVGVASVSADSLVRPLPVPKAIVLDLARGALYGTTSCDGGARRRENAYSRSNYFFRFGPLLKVCDDASYRTFMRLYATRVADAARAAASQGGASLQDQRAFCLDEYAEADRHPENDYEVELYPTFNGLAVHRASFDGAWKIGVCAAFSRLNPTIIPWSDLAPLMQPGSWREEFLTLAYSSAPPKHSREH